MGRRSTHSSGQLRELIIRSAHDIIAESGLGGASAREIARRAGYSPGTLYNLFDSLDDLLLEVEGLLLESLDQRLSELKDEVSPHDKLSKLARKYLSFSQEHANLWRLIALHELPTGSKVPSWYVERFDRLLAHIENALACQVPATRDRPHELKRSARVLWAGLHGLTSLSAGNKLSGMVDGPVDALVDDLLDRYVAGLQHQQTKQGGGA